AARSGADRAPRRRGRRGVGSGGRPLLRDQEDRVRLSPLVERVPRTATAAITALTALAWIIAEIFGQSQKAADQLGFIPFHIGHPAAGPAAPAFLTPLTATLVHSGPIHLGFNLLIFFWCGTQVERVLGRTGLILLYLVGAYASAMTQWATAPASTVPMVGASGAISAV